MVGFESGHIPSGNRDVEAAAQPRDMSSKRPVLLTLRSAKSFILLVVIFAWFTASSSFTPTLVDEAESSQDLFLYGIVSPILHRYDENVED